MLSLKHILDEPSDFWSNKLKKLANLEAIKDAILVF